MNALDKICSIFSTFYLATALFKKAHIRDGYHCDSDLVTEFVLMDSSATDTARSYLVCVGSSFLLDIRDEPNVFYFKNLAFIWACLVRN